MCLSFLIFAFGDCLCCYFFNSWAQFIHVFVQRTLYVGGLDEKVDEEVLKSAFIPFGDIKDVQIPKDFATGILLRHWTQDIAQTRSAFVHLNVMFLEKARGFGFVQFEDIEDAEAAMDNMHSMSGRAIVCWAGHAVSDVWETATSKITFTNARTHRYRSLPNEHIFTSPQRLRLILGHAQMPSCLAVC